MKLNPRLKTIQENMQPGAYTARMKYFTDVGREAPETVVLMDGIYEVLVDDHRGYIPCPFADNVRELKTNTKLLNREQGREIYWSDLNIHMIGEHGFYEGRGSFFRTEPAELAKILGLIG